MIREPHLCWAEHRGPSSVQSGALVRATSAQGQSRAAQREALRSGSTVAPSTTGGGHSYELDELLTALPQRLLHSAADSLHRFLASGDNPRTGRAPSLVQDAVFGASESGLAADFAHAHRKVTMSDSGGAVNGSGIGAEVVPSATVTVLARIAWRWLRWAQLAVADLCGGPRLVEGASGAQQVRPELCMTFCSTSGGMPGGAGDCDTCHFLCTAMRPFCPVSFESGCCQPGNT